MDDDRPVTVHLQPDVSPYSIRAEHVDRPVPGFLSLMDPEKMDTAGTKGFDIDGREYLLVNVDNVIAIEGDHDRIDDDLLVGDGDG